MPPNRRPWLNVSCRKRSAPHRHRRKNPQNLRHRCSLRRAPYFPPSRELKVAAAKWEPEVFLAKATLGLFPERGLLAEVVVPPYRVWEEVLARPVFLAS